MNEITDEAVERAAREMHRMRRKGIEWDDDSMAMRYNMLYMARRILAAAFEVDLGDGGITAAWDM